MMHVLVLLVTLLIALLILKYKEGKWQFASAARIAMAAMLFFTAIGHFMSIREMYRIAPDSILSKKGIMYAIGVLEVLLGIGLLLPKYRKIVAWTLIAFFILLLPGNVGIALDNINYLADGFNDNRIYDLWLRVPIQFCFILWVYFSAIKPDFFTGIFKKEN